MRILPLLTFLLAQLAPATAGSQTPSGPPQPIPAVVSTAIHLRDTTAQAVDLALHLRGLKGMGKSGMGMMDMMGMTPKSMTSKTAPPAMSMTMGKKTETPTTQPTPAPTAPPFEEIDPTCTPCTAGSPDPPVSDPPRLCYTFNNDTLKAVVDAYTTDDETKEAMLYQYGPIECW
ncbi:hypothetical protein TeGR_g7218 [Tetraparma gracilis]|uniref:Uncharacterized protein n=1 Tax=Tetraparma gracilis TaxID=2962635 RepID=A0ABQ6MV74_9STRA|nr:hypothetical protein TeGR_g7218 [Tetraparma gracilis]